MQFCQQYEINALSSYLCINLREGTVPHAYPFSAYATGPQLIDRIYRMGDGRKLPITELTAPSTLGPRQSVELESPLTWWPTSY